MSSIKLDQMPPEMALAIFEQCDLKSAKAYSETNRQLHELFYAAIYPKGKDLEERRHICRVYRILNGAAPKPHQPLPEFREEIEKITTPTILLSLDSNHTENHVYSELNSLAEFVTEGSYAIVWDSRIGDLSKLTHLMRPQIGRAHV